MRWTRQVTSLRDRRGTRWDLGENPEGKIYLGRPKRKWEDVIKVYI